ncbi:CHAT domain-containing protein [Planktothricoides raciborskii]|uniref:CHAT domain-containing protein n=1 Tax=Planktothricoides raciborskii FACHB-1370 TaxID=2949576 RepID=A0ABR8ED49_9CYAN|nr:CHAT domain-containing protein [Planktothricoides raciborskii]MBD2544779.1 CHAT domain-containing protein [Planktothricoides raciborskii FACHB-1370]
MDSQQLFTQICGFLDQQDYSYQPDSEQQRLLLSVNDIAVLIAVEEDGEFIKIILPQLLTVPADHPHYEAALETLAYFGWQHKLVRWQRDPDDGEVRVQADLPIEDSELTAKQFWRILQGAVQIAQQGQERLQQVLATGQDTGNSQNPGTNQETLAFFGALLLAEMKGGEAAVYQLLDQRGGQLDPQLPQAAQTYLEMVSTAKPEMRDGVVGLIEDLAISLRQYPRGRWQVNLTVAIGLYHLVLEARPRETVPDKYAQTLTNLGNAYCIQAELGEQPSANLQKAIAVYDEAAKIRRKLGLEKDLSRTLNNLGNAYRNQAELGEQPSANLQKAIAAYDEAANIFRKLGLEKDLSTTLTNLGVAYLTQAQLGEQPSENLQKAIAAYDEAAKIRRKLGLEEDLSSTLTNLGVAYLTQAELGEQPSANLQKAIAAYDEAAKIRRELKLEKDLSSTLTNLGSAYLTQAQLGEQPSANLQKAIAAYDEAAKISRKLGLEKDLSSTLTGLGVAYQTQAELGEQPSANLQKAIAFYDEAAKIRRELKLEKDLSSTLTNLGSAYLTQAQLGEQPSANLQKAIAACDEAAKIFRKLGLEKDLSSTLTGLGVAYCIQAELGEQPSANLQKAIAAYDEAAKILRKLKLEKDLSGTLNNLGNAYLTQAELGEQPSENRQKAVNCYREALEFLRPQLLPVECLKTARALGNLGFQQGDWQMALEGYQTAMAAVDYSRTQRVSNAEREEVVKKSIYIYENAIQAAINLNDIPTALEIVERVRAKRLVDLLATADLYQNGDIPEPVRQYLQKLNDLDDQIAQKRGELSDDSRETKPDGSKTRQLRAATAVSEDIAQLEQQKAVILDQLSNLDEVVAKLRQVQPPKLADFIPLLQDSPGAAILSFYTTDDDTHIFILRHGETVPTCFTCQGQGYKTLQLWLGETWVIPYISNKTQWVAQMSATLAELSRRLEIDRLIAEQLQGLDELILIPHLFLHQIPFAALPVSHPSASGTSPYQGEAGWGDDSSHTPPTSHTGRKHCAPTSHTGRKHCAPTSHTPPPSPTPHTPPPSPPYFGDKFILRYAPSVQVLGFCHNRSAVTAQEYGIVENATNDLPCSGFEGAKVAEFFGVGQEKRLIGTDATRQKYRQLLENTTHLVSTHHAQSRYDNPQESGLLLSDGRITVSQLLSPGWRFKDLDEIFLSCCETGLFLPNSALDEPVAVSTGFLCAGARGVIASHWSIYDLSAALLSILYHNQRKAGKNRPVALQAAQQEMREMTGAEFKSKYQKALEAHFKAEKARLQAIPGYDPNLLTRVVDSEKNIKRYAADKGCPFQEPVHWGSLGCYGLR